MAYREQRRFDGKIGLGDQWRHMTRIERVLFVFAGVNFFALIAASLWLGGDAANGKIEAGRYFLGDHGRYHEVSAPIYHASLLQILSVFLITHPLGIYAGFRGHRRAKKARTSVD